MGLQIDGNTQKGTIPEYLREEQTFILKDTNS